MNTLKKLLLSAVLLIGGVCAMNAQEKTTTAGVPVVKLNNGVEMLENPQRVDPVCQMPLTLAAI